MASIAAQSLIGAAQVAAQFAPVPWLGAATGVVVALVNMFAKAESNKYVLSSIIHGVPIAQHRYGIIQLQDRCLSLMVIIQNEGQHLPEDQQKRLCSGAQ